MKKNHYTEMAPKSQLKLASQTQSKRKQNLGIAITYCSVIISCVLIAVAALRNYIISTNMPNYYAGDITSLNADVDDFSTILCSRYKVSPLFTTADVYLLPSKAKVDESKTFNSSETIENLDEYKNTKERGYNFLPGSTLDISACYRKGVQAEMLVIKGDANYNRWNTNRNCRTCVWKKLTLDSSTNCSANIYTNLTAHVTSQDVYHLVITRLKESHKPYPWSFFTSNINVFRTGYDVTGYTETCQNVGGSCLLNLTYNSQPDIVMRFYTTQYTTKASLITQCQTRLIFWFGLFLLLPAVLMALGVSVLYLLLFRERN